MTVSRVLRCTGYVSDYTRAKVWQAVRQLGYQPNRAAQALASRRAR
jgi:DNA-binding LacI/PurR family transcriptional regulator